MTRPRSALTEESFRPLSRHDRNKANQAYDRLRSCVCKKALPTLEIAKRVAEQTAKSTRKNYAAYKCRYCSWYHVGSFKPS